MARIDVRVNNTAIQALFDPGGGAYDRIRAAGALAKDLAKGKVNNRTHFLSSTITYRTRVRRYACGFDLNAAAYYAGWVNNGTRAIITPTHASYLLVPVSRSSTSRVKRAFVRGQRGQHFLEYGAIHGLQFAGLPVPPGLHF